MFITYRKNVSIIKWPIYLKSKKAKNSSLAKKKRFIESATVYVGIRYYIFPPKQEVLSNVVKPELTTTFQQRPSL